MYREKERGDGRLDVWKEEEVGRRGSRERGREGKRLCEGKSETGGRTT